jgi:putative flippase GtrA
VSLPEVSGERGPRRGFLLIAWFKSLTRWLWARHREKVLYLAVGGWNTLFTYGCFSFLYYFLHSNVYPSVILAIAYVVASINGFLGFRYIVFKPAGNGFIEYAKYQLVYAPILALNLVGLPLALQHTRLSAYAIQAFFAAFAVVASYLGNKYFTFRRVRREPQ